MKNGLLSIVCIGIFAFHTISSFGQNGLSFDGIDDYASASNASALISGKNAISLSMWVYPKSSPAGYPDFEGFAGFRNESNADFYVLQLSSNNLEARFRNSSGTNFTITYNGGLNIAAWNHLVLTYNGTQLKLYHDGSLVQTISATGTISNNSLPFGMGYVPFGSNNFYLNGDLDDVGLWDKALSANEVSTLYTSCGMNTNDPNLVLCYQLNQGIANGNNSSITSAIDAVGNINATLNNMAMSGSTSNFVTGTSGNTASSMTITSCHSFVTPSGMRLTTSGTYYDTIPNTNGCDSIITIALTVDSIDVTVNVMGDTLMAAQAGAVYRWYNCTSGTKIIGQVNRFYIPPVSGVYAVIITKGGCVDTSDCITFTKGIGMEEAQPLNRVNVYPNPSSGEFNLDFGNMNDPVKIEILNLAGQQIWSKVHVGGGKSSFRLEAPSGVYMIRLSAKSTNRIIRFILE